MSDEAETPDPTELITKLARAEERARILGEQLERQSQQQVQAPKQEAPARYTRSQLQAMVDAGQIDEGQMDAVLRDQDRRETEETVTDRVRKQLQAEERAKQIAKDEEAYLEAIPALRDRSSPEWQQCNKEYGRLVTDRGLPEGNATRLLAVEKVFGDLDSLKAPPEERRPVHRETGGGTGRGKQAKTPKLPAIFDSFPEHKERILSEIDRGIFTGPDDPRIASEAKAAERVLKRKQERQAVLH